MELISKPFISNFDVSNLITNGPVKTLSEIKTVTNADLNRVFHMEVCIYGWYIALFIMSESQFFIYIYLSNHFM